MVWRGCGGSAVDTISMCHEMSLSASAISTLPQVCQMGEQIRSLPFLFRRSGRRKPRGKQRAMRRGMCATDGAMCLQAFAVAAEEA